MLTSAQKNAARNQSTALIGIGFTKHRAVAMAARQLRKSLPMIDTSAADQRREEREQQQRNGSIQKRDAMPNATRPKQRTVTGKNGRPLSLSRFNIKHTNGKVWGYEVKPNGALVVRPPSRFDVPTYTEQQWRAIHEGISSHISEQGQPATPKKDATMQKSKLDSLIDHARKNPSKLQPQTLQALNKHLEKTGKPAITLPAPVPRWGTMPTISDIANNVQHAVSKTPAPSHAIPAPGQRMTTQELQEHRLQQARELEQRRIVEAKEAPKGAVVASWIGGGVMH